MPNMLDYLSQRGGLSFDEAPLSPVDALILSTLSYVQFDNLISQNLREAPKISELSQMLLELPFEAQKSRLRDRRDGELLEAMGKSRRFGPLRLTGARELTDDQRELQFAAITLLLENGGALLAFRGTDGTLTGWKEDLNLSFLDVIPGQEASRAYLEDMARLCPGKLYVAGHSKGGNLAVYGAVRSRDDTRKRVEAVYNYDGPGFRKRCWRIRDTKRCWDGYIPLCRRTLWWECFSSMKSPTPWYKARRKDCPSMNPIPGRCPAMALWSLDR